MLLVQTSKITRVPDVKEGADHEVDYGHLYKHNLATLKSSVKLWRSGFCGVAVLVPGKREFCPQGRGNSSCACR